MMFKTHVAFGFLIGLLSISYLMPGNQILFILLVMIGASIPDIDHPRSKLGKYLKPINFLFEHRGFFHSLFMLFVVYMVVYFIKKIYALPLAIGFLSHIISDAITKQGIMPLHPFSRVRIRGFIGTGSAIEYLFFILFVAADVYLMIKL